jgi:hypothetical protein
MVSSGILRYVVLVRTDVSEELSASFIRVTRIGELGTTLAVTSNRRTLLRKRASVALLSTHLHMYYFYKLPPTYVEWCLLGCYAMWFL